MFLEAEEEAVEGARGLSRVFRGKEEFSKEWRGWSSGKMREGGETALLHRVARAAALCSGLKYGEYARGLTERWCGACGAR